MRNGTTISPRKARRLLSAVALGVAAAMLLTGCSVLGMNSKHRVEHFEYDPEMRITYHTVIEEEVPPGGKKISNGNVNIGVNVDGDWHLRMGALVETDATGTAAMIQGVMAQQTELIKVLMAQIMMMQAAGALPVPVP